MKIRRMRFHSSTAEAVVPCEGGWIFASGLKTWGKAVRFWQRPNSPLKKWLSEAVQKVPDARQAKHAPAKAGVHVTMRRTSCTLNDEG